MNISLSTEQQTAVDAAISAINNKTLFKIGGYAGTGKTTVAKWIVAKLPGCMPCAFTGKAAYRLRQKGITGAATIHSTIYNFDKHTRTFNLKDKSELAGDWFLIDEGSMISKQLWCDLNSFDLPILLLGDPGQLEPVGADPELMHKADVVLEQIHRQAEGNGIIELATDIRLSKQLAMQYQDVKLFNGNSKATVGDLKWADIVICAFNRTRIRINKKYRKLHGYAGPVRPGEQIIVIRNNGKFNVFNGQMLTVKSIDDAIEGRIIAVCVTDDGNELKLPLLEEQFNKKPFNMFRHDIVLADFGYCITCHKSQGSEWDKVLVIDEQCPKLWDATRWRYTAVTRAAKELRYYL